MDKLLKTGLSFMFAAVILMPVAFLLKNNSHALMIGFLGFAMGLELIGLIFVIFSIIKRKKT